MKKLVALILLFPTMFFSFHGDAIEEKKATEENTISTPREEDSTPREEIRSTENAKRQTEYSEKTKAAAQGIETKAPVKFDLEEFARQDALRQQQRLLEDKQLKERWKLEDQKEEEIRSQRSLFQKAFEKLSGVDSTATEEKNAVRSKLLFEKNKARMREDFERQTEKFDALATKHPQFSQGDGETLLRIGRMNNFITMDKDNRTQLLKSVEEVVSSDRLANFSVEAMQDLVKLTHLSQTETLSQEFDTTLTTEITPANDAEVKTNLLNLLKTSINQSLTSMKAYSNVIESDTIQDSINDLAAIRRVKNFSNNATMVLGCAGLTVMLIPGVSHIASAIHLTAERLFIGAKALFLGAHASGSLEGEFERRLQDKYVDAFQNLLPKTTQLLKTEAIKTEIVETIEKEEEEGLLSKADAYLEQREFLKIGDRYKKLKSMLKSTRDKFKSGLQSMGDSAKSHLKSWSNDFSNSPAGKTAKEFGKKIKDTLAKYKNEDSINRIKHEYSLAHEPTEEEKNRIAKEEEKKALIQKEISKLEQEIGAYKTNTFDIHLYELQDKLVQQQRAQEDLLRELDWQAEDRAAKKQRDSQIFTERILKGASTDAGIDKEKETVRNKEIIDINRKRMQEDFDTKAKRFNSFVESKPEFAKKAPWNNLLKLGDMNAFVTMSPEERETLIKNIETSMNDFFTDESQTFDDKDIEAATQLVSLTNLYRPSGSKLTPEISKKLELDLASQDPTQIKQALKKFFQNSTNSTLKTLRDFSKNLDVTMDTLEKIRTAKNASFASMMIVGIAGVAVMVAGHPFVFHAVKIGLEQCAIVGKVTLVGAHLSSHSERDMVREIQDEYVKIFQPLLPESTRLLESTKFENTAKTIGQRVKEFIQGTDFYKNHVKPLVDKVSAITKPYTDAGKAAVKNAASQFGQAVVKGANAIHANVIKPSIDSVSRTAKTVYKAITPQVLQDAMTAKNAKQRQKLQSQFTLAPTATSEQPNPPSTKVTAAPADSNPVDSATS